MFKFFIMALPFIVMGLLFFGAYAFGGSTLPGILAIICLVIAVVVFIKGASIMSQAKRAALERENNASLED